MRRVLIVLACVAALMMLGGPALAHNLVVTNPRTGDVVTVRWIGGDVLPAPAQEAPPMFGPFNLPPSHEKGLPNACHGTANSAAVTIQAPPFFTGCEHGMP